MYLIPAASTVFLIGWTALYLSRDGGFWNRIEENNTLPDWGDEQSLVVALLTLYLFFILLGLNNFLRTKSEVSYLLLYLFLLHFSALVFSLSYNRLNEAFVAAILLLFLTFILALFLWKLDYKYLSYCIIVFTSLIYICIWTGKIM